MTTKSQTEAARRKAAERARKRAQGLISLEYWILPEHRPRLDKYVEKLRREMELLAWRAPRACASRRPSRCSAPA
jgi:hypothetical protein